MIHQHHSGEFEDEELKPCPFCGGEAELAFSGNDYTKKRECKARCKECRVSILNGAIRHSSEWIGRLTIKQWNKRT